jgi:predicted AlkP superfamily pyrophosphatase or phosphodiesterase
MRSSDRKKLILVLIDALGASYFAAQRSRLPYLSRMAERGVAVARVTPAIPGTSRPGRASMLTGADTSVHAVYGNNLLESGAFRPATACDVEVATIARMALDAGRDVASLGFGMLRPGDTSLQIDPWWEHLAYQGLTNIKIPSSGDIFKVRRDPEGRLSGLLEKALGSGGHGALSAAGLHPHVIGLASDQLMLELAANLACGDRPPDLILTEFSTTDLVQHYQGFDSAATNWCYQVADMAIGLLLHRLALAGRMDDYAVMVAGDHGQAPIERAIYPEFLIPHDRWATEGASLHVVWRDSEEGVALDRRFSELGVRRLDGSHLPAGAREKGLVTYVAPKGSGFERSPEGSRAREVAGPPTIVSTHGLAPGDPGDDAVAIIAGAGEAHSLGRGDLRQIAPTIASILGLATEGFAMEAWV